MEMNGLHIVNTSHMHHVQTGLHMFNTVWMENSEHFVLMSSLYNFDDHFEDLKFDKLIGTEILIMNW